jgi:hypothetical protein
MTVIPELQRHLQRRLLVLGVVSIAKGGAMAVE